MHVITGPFSRHVRCVIADAQSLEPLHVIAEGRVTQAGDLLRAAVLHQIVRLSNASERVPVQRRAEKMHGCLIRVPVDVPIATPCMMDAHPVAKAAGPRYRKQQTQLLPDFETLNNVKTD